MAACRPDGDRLRFGRVTRLGPLAAFEEALSARDLDALICAVQAAWGRRLLARGGLDGLGLSEGWISDPDTVPRLRAA